MAWDADQPYFESPKDYTLGMKFMQEKGLKPKLEPSFGITAASAVAFAPYQKAFIFLMKRLSYVGRYVKKSLVDIDEARERIGEEERRKVQENKKRKNEEEERKRREKEPRSEFQR
jgi:hypothetical protein